MRTWKLDFSVALLIYSVLAISIALTKGPYNDEGWFSLTAQEFLTSGKFATPLVDTAGRTWAHIHDRNYMILPGYPMLLAGWFAITGPGLIAARMFSVLCGGICLWSLYLIVSRMLGCRVTAAFSCAILALDYPFLAVAANARMDISALMLGLAAIAVYLVYRESHLLLSIGIAELLAAGSVLNHINGIVAFAILHLFIFHLDRQRLRPVHFLVALLPYVVLGGFYAHFIWADLPEYQAQFGTQSTGRLRPLWQPVELWYGIKEGILDCFGLSSVGTQRAIRYNLVALAVYIASLGAVLASPAIRRMRNMKPMLLAIALAAGWLMLHRSTVSHLYIVFLTSFLVVPVAVMLTHWERSLLPRAPVWFAMACILFALSTAGTLNRVRQNDYRKFTNVLAHLHENPLRREGIFASCEFGMPLGSLPELTDDNLLGFYSHRTAGVIVMDFVYAAATTDWAPTGENDKTAFAAYREKLLREAYDTSFDNGRYRVFTRRQPTLRNTNLVAESTQ